MSYRQTGWIGTPGSSRERHFVSVSLPARASFLDAPPLSRSAPSDGILFVYRPLTQESLRRNGIQISEGESEVLLKRLDRNNSLSISWEEWRDSLLWQPHADFHDILHYWRHATFLDIGEDSLVPDDFTETEIQTGMWWRHLVAGGAAGAVSRTCTAPLDRLKGRREVSLDSIPFRIRC